MSIPIQIYGERYHVGASMFYVTPCDIPGLLKIPGLCRLRLPELGQTISSDELRALADKIEEVFGRYTLLDDATLGDAEEAYQHPTPESYGGTD